MFLKKLIDSSQISIRWRLALIFVITFGALTVGFNILLFNYTIQTLEQDFDDALFNYAVDVAESIDIGRHDLSVLSPLQIEHGKILPFPLGNALIQVRHISGKILARVGQFGTFDPPFKDDFKKLRQGEEAVFRTIEHIQDIPSAEADSYRLINFPLDTAKKPRLMVQIAVPMTLLETQISNRLRLMQLGIPLVLLLATLAGLLFSARALAPVTSMIQVTRGMGAQDLSLRLPVPEARDEIRELALTLNEMFSRIQQAFSSQERFVADASHQLMTPLTIMRGELELANKSGSDESRPLVKSLLQEVDSLSKIVQQMLVLARADAGQSALNLQKLVIDELVFEALAPCEKMASTKNISFKLTVESDLQNRPAILGDQDLLLQLFINVFENALKYSPSNGVVEISINILDNAYRIIVDDQGSGIPEQHLPYIFERFSRANTAGHIKGFGLGLAIAAKIVLLHNGHISAQNRPDGGARFIIELPISRD